MMIKLRQEVTEMIERQLGDVGTRLVWENERVRIWEMVLAPGERSAVHEHTLDYLLIPLEGDRIGVEVEPDTAGAYRESGDFAVPIGRAHFTARGGIETAVNTGSEQYREILIELKDA
jgi:predicted metal-dependent enzyme (double-stranded beta helix superfamily)